MKFGKMSMYNASKSKPVKKDIQSTLGTIPSVEAADTVVEVGEKKSGYIRVGDKKKRGKPKKASK